MRPGDFLCPLIPGRNRGPLAVTPMVYLSYTDLSLSSGKVPPREVISLLLQPFRYSNAIPEANFIYGGLRMRNSGSTRSGQSFDNATINAVWAKGKIVPGYDPAVYRQDVCNWWMQRNAYGNTSHQFGWEIDHIVPVAAGGSDNLSNLQPLHWKNNRSKGDNYPHWYCAVA